MPRRYQVEVSAAARADVRDIRRYIAADKPGAAAKWVRTFGRHARSLRLHPLRYEAILEAEELGLPLRHFIFGNYRIVYLVEDDKVTVVRVIHAARPLRPDVFDA